MRKRTCNNRACAMQSALDHLVKSSELSELQDSADEHNSSSNAPINQRNGCQ